MERKCLFCGNNNLSNEHIIAQWLLKELNIYDDFISISHISLIDMQKSSRQHPFSKLVNGLVCTSCNNGWMSKLEDKNKEVLTDLLNYKNLTKSIEHLLDENITFSKWAFKNAILFNYASNYRKLVPSEHFRLLYNGEIPKNVFIHIGFVDDKPILETRQSPMDLVIKSSDIPVNHLNDSYRITIKLKHLMVKVVFYNSSKQIYYDDTGAIEFFPNVHVIKELKEFKDIDDFDINGAIHEFY